MSMSLSDTQTDPQKVHFISLGCPKNRIDTETMLAGLQGEYAITPDAEDADVVVVNTCAFVDSAKQESIDTILEVADLKEEGQVKKLIVGGCLSQRYADELAQSLPEVDHFLGTNDLSAVREILDHERISDTPAERLYISDPDRIGFDWEMPRVNTMNGHSAYLKICLLYTSPSPRD